MTEGYIKIRDLLDFCDNQKEHSATPNDIMRMNHSYFMENYPCWISVKDRLPDVMPCEYLVVNNGAVGLAIYHDGLWIAPSRSVNVTHWMPLPEPPKEEDDAAD